MPEHLTSLPALKPPECWRRVWKKSPIFKGAKEPENMTPEEIKKELVKILFDSKWQEQAGVTDREVLTIVILREKAHFFDFLKGYTSWKTIGRWEEIVEPNLQIDIEFYDTRDEAIGNRVMHLLFEYNKKVVKEQVLYVRTTPVEEGTLFPWE